MTAKMNISYLLIGTNEGDREQHLLTAMDLTKKNIGNVTATSHIYETAAWGRHDQPDFLNQVFVVKTLHNAERVMNIILQLEHQMGRVRTKKNDPRIIDIDILFFNNEIWNRNDLKIPHAEIQNRRFALTPMNELAPDLVHPLLNKSIAELLRECNDPLEVRIFG